ncbi:MAG: hypothetical protein WBA74_10760 [Cyclobacteriaceae bacterium]
MKLKTEIIIPPGLNSDTCIIPVCGGSAEMNGAYFKNYVGEAGKHFKNVRLVLCDTLDTYNMADKNSALWKQAYEVSRSSGDRWLRKHFDFVKSSFLGDVNLTRWDDIKQDSLFEDRFSISCHLYQSNQIIKDWVHRICNHYVDLSTERAYARGHSVNKAKMLKRSIDYMLEEIAGTATYYNWFKCPAVYPGEYFDDPDLFNRHSKSEISMTMPSWCKVSHEQTKSLVA